MEKTPRPVYLFSSILFDPRRPSSSYLPSPLRVWASELDGLAEREIR